MAYEETKERARAMWSAGDYAPTGRQLQPASDALVQAMGIGAGQLVLDVAAGHGNCAVASARRGARVVASDFSPVMVAAGRERTSGAGLDIAWREADAADLPFDDRSFDRVTSVFGAIFAPEQQKVASEAMRVLRPGGMVGITAWTADGYPARLRELLADYALPTAGDVPDSSRWGQPDEVRSLFEQAGGLVDVRPRTVTFRYGSWEEWSRSVEAHGTAVTARRTMLPETYEDLRRRRQALTAEYNHGHGEMIAVDAPYLEILAVKRPR